MRIGAAIVALWLIVGLIASIQRGYFNDNSTTNCAKASDTILTIVAGPLNYMGVNPKVNCSVPQPSQ